MKGIEGSLNYFQIIFNPTSTGELAAMPKDLQLRILAEFKGLEDCREGGFGTLERGRKRLHRYRLGHYRIYFEYHELGVVVHRILSRNTLKDFFFRNTRMTSNEDETLAENPKFWKMIGEAAAASRAQA